MTNGDQKGMTSGDRKSIPETNNKRIAVKDPFCWWITKWAGSRRHRIPVTIPLRVTVNTAGSPAAKHSGHRHTRTGRLASRRN